MIALFSLPSFFSDRPWSIPVIGLLVTSLAFLAGRRWLAPRPVPKVEEPPLEEVLPMLTTAKLKKSEPDRRAAPRRKGNRVEVYVAGESKASPMLGWVVDRSMGGLCLIVEKPLSEGEMLNVRPRTAPVTAAWIPIEIRSCRPEGDDWEIGCRFVKPPQWNDLLHFG
jgi:hypothetical protein